MMHILYIKNVILIAIVHSTRRLNHCNSLLFVLCELEWSTVNIHHVNINEKLMHKNIILWLCQYVSQL